MSASIKAGLNNDMHLMTDGVTRAYVDSNGKVGIGTTSPSKKFVVSEGGAHGFEISPYDGSQNATRLINYNRSTNAYFPLEIEASQIAFETNGSEKMRIDPSGYVTTPQQPAFMVTNVSTSTLANNDYPLFNQTIFNRGSIYNASNGRFTAPVAGLYAIGIHIRVHSDTNSISYHRISLLKNNSYLNHSRGRLNGRTSGDYSYIANYIIVELAVNDYITSQVETGSGTTLNLSSNVESAFYGHLIG
jgi:hypothetical protein